jgi:hypothetical protein
MNEISSKGKKSNVLDIDVNYILREQKEDLGEGMFSSALKTAATNLVPGGRWVSDYAQARGFDDLEGAVEEFDRRLESIEERLAALESVATI